MINDQDGSKSSSNSIPMAMAPIASSSDLDFSIIDYSGYGWSIQYRGNHTNLMQPKGKEPATSVDVVIVKASDRCGQDGLKNLAVVPLDNLRNDPHGGPMLLRVPASSLGGMARFAEDMLTLGYPYYSFGIRILVDTNDGRPTFLFNSIRPLTDKEADVVIELRVSPLVTHILTGGGLQKSGLSTAATPPNEPIELKGGIYAEADALSLLNSNFFLADQGSAFPVARIIGNGIEYVGDKDFKNKLANIWVRVLDMKGEAKQKFAEPW